jgi:hypothetical protein
MPLNWRRVTALRRLAVLYARHTVRRGFHRMPQDGLARFEELYTPDRITAITALEREQMAAHGRCIGCGLCGFAAARAGYLRAERLPSQLTRSLPDMWTSRELDLGGVDWEAAAAVCPAGVPLAEMSRFVTDRLQRDGTAAPAVQAAPRALPDGPI